MMDFRAANVIRSALFSAILVLGAASAMGQSSGFEVPPAFNAQNVLPPSLSRGANHTVGNPVQNDGFHNIYNLQTPFGDYSITGTELLKVRVREAEVAAKLAEISGSDEMLKSAGRTAIKPLKTAEGLIARPGETLKGTFKGVGRFFGRVGAGMDATDPEKEGLIASVTGGSEAKRRLAYKYGVDPYSQFEPLSDQLSRLASVSAVGGTAAGVGMAFVPGGAGVAISVGSTSGNLLAFLRDKTVAELEQLGRAELTRMGVDEGTINTFYLNRFLTPTDKTIIVYSLGELANTRNRSAFVARAAQSSTVPRAFALRRRIELIVAYNNKVARIESFTTLGGVPMMQTQAGLVALFAIDYLPWTQELARMVDAANRDRQAVAGNARIDMWITGRASERTIANLKKSGWSVFETAADRLGG